MARAHRASHADVLTVAAAKCTSEVLAGQVDIASHCEAQGFPLFVRCCCSYVCMHVQLLASMDLAPLDHRLLACNRRQRLGIHAH